MVCAWYSVNGERLGTYNGHQGALWTVDIDPTSTLLATGAADNTIKIWNVQTGKSLKTWDFPTAVKRVEFSEDGTLLLAVTEQRMGHLGTVVVFPIIVDVDAVQADAPLFTITFRESKATVAAWSYLNKYIITGHEDGTVSQYDGKVLIGPLRDEEDWDRGVMADRSAGFRMESLSRTYKHTKSVGRSQISRWHPTGPTL